MQLGPSAADAKVGHLGLLVATDWRRGGDPICSTAADIGGRFRGGHHLRPPVSFMGLRRPRGGASSAGRMGPAVSCGRDSGRAPRR